MPHNDYMNTMTLRLSLLGTYQAQLANRTLSEFGTNKARILLAYLAVESDRPHERSHLACLLWPNATSEQALSQLRQTLHRLNQLVEVPPGHPPILHITRQTVHLDPTRVTVDAIQLTTALATASHHRHRSLPACRTCITSLVAALDLYHGPFLEGSHSDDSLKLEHWLLTTRDHIDRQVAAALSAIASYHERRTEYDRAEAALSRWLAVEPWAEEAHRRLMAMLAAKGQRSAALAQYERCRRVLATHLGVAPELPTVELAARIRDGRLPASHALVADTLPLPADTLVGRDEQLATIAERLANPDCRLLTIVGPGGSGKTSLARAALAAHQFAFADGASFVSLAVVDRPEQLAAAIAQHLGIPDQPQTSPEERLRAHLSCRELLLVLDNFEHLVAAADLLPHLLNAAPSLVLLATSREPLRVSHEWLLPLDGLATPPEDWHDQHPERFSAIDLFLRSARRVAPGFTPNPDDLAAIAAITRTVAGLPLGIELAAGHVRHWPPAIIAAEMQRDLDTLTTNLRDYPERHRSLRAVLDSSWRLLSALEQQVLAAAAVFEGPFSAEAAAVVCLPQEQGQADATRPLLDALVDRSLVRPVPDGRYELHDLVRRFARMYLEQGELVSVTEVRQRHSKHFLQRAARQGALLHTQTARAAAAIHADLPNIRVAWSWAAQHGQFDVLLTVLNDLADFYIIKGMFEEAIRVFEVALQPVRARHDRGAPDEALARLLSQIAWMYYHLSQYELAWTINEEVIALAEQLNDPQPKIQALISQGCLLWRNGDAGGGYNRTLTALEIARAQGDTALREQVLALYYLSVIAFGQGELADSEARELEALRICHAAGHSWSAGNILSQLSLTCTYRGDYARAAKVADQALAIYQAYDDRGNVQMAYLCRGMVATHQGAYPEAEEALALNIAACREIHDLQNESVAAAMLGFLSLRTGAYDAVQSACNQAYTISHALNHGWGLSIALLMRGLLTHHLGDDAAAAGALRSALDLTERAHNRMLAAYALTYLGHALAKTDPDEAAAAYHRAIDLRHATGQQHLAPEALAGQARLALARRDVTAALAHVEPILGRDPAHFYAVEEPFRVAHTCYQALAAAHDPRATEVLEDAVGRLRAQLERLTDERARAAFRAIPAHRALLEAAGEPTPGL
ncbi:MAG: hypothetical protein RLZZ387_990 [Chloroflexota bacterium]